MSARRQSLQVGAKKILSFLKDAVTVALITLVLLGVLEAVLVVYYRRVDEKSTHVYNFDKERMRADGYKCTTWIDDYFNEVERMSFRWEPYVYWRKSPFSGKYVNIDSQGIRRTWNSDVRTTRPLRVWVFGGSTVWGLGVRDDFTLPSWLARELSAARIPVNVVNFGQQGYNSTQELIALFLLLRNEQRPDLVIFYDGVNEVLSAGKQGQAGIPVNERHRALEFQSTGVFLAERLKRQPSYFEDVISRTRIVRFAGDLRARITGKPESTAFTSSIGEDTYIQGANVTRDLSSEVIRMYQFNMSVAKLLSQRFGADILAYWQPVPMVHKKLTPYELYAIDVLAQNNRAVHDLYYKVYGQIDALAAQGKLQDCQSLDRIFEDVAEPCYIDFCHLTEDANRVVAQRLAKDAIPILQSRMKAAVSHD